MAEIQDRVQLRPSWEKRLGQEFGQEYMLSLREFLVREEEAGKIIYPEGANIFNGMNLLSFDDVKVVILGQDPYHGQGQAHGLSFSVMPGVRTPPSLQNIYKELHADLDVPISNHGCLTSWAEQGVLLLNAVLTVEKSKPASHHGQGWERFTDAVITSLSNEHSGLVFLLWGNYAQKKGQIIDKQKHLVLQSAHPSPFSAHRGFLGNKHFSKTNEYLLKNGKTVMNWELPPVI